MVVLLLHERYEVLGDHPAVHEELLLCLLFLGLLKELARLVADGLVFTFKNLQPGLRFLSILLVEFELFL